MNETVMQLHDKQVLLARTRVGKEIASWEQQKTLAPPPYAFGSASYDLKRGLDVGDAALDDKTTKWLLQRVHGAGDLPQFADPPWANHVKARRGQEVFQKYYFAFQLGLFSCLTSGFAIGRFSDVLVESGYARSPLATYKRFHHTSQAVHKWVCYPLDDPQSPGRESIVKVRCMHAYARQRAAAAWAKDPSASAGAGVPLSQFDMAQVQMAFSSILWTVVSTEMGCNLSDQEKDDLRELWRLIGWHLGILDGFNVCECPSRMRDLRDEFFASQQHYARSLRPSTAVLVDSTFTGFARYTGTGRRCISSFLSRTGRNRPWYDGSYLPVQDRSPLFEAVLERVLPLTSNSALRPFFNQRLRAKIEANNSDWMLRYCIHPLSVARDACLTILDLAWYSRWRVVILLLIALVITRRRQKRYSTLVAQ